MDKGFIQPHKPAGKPELHPDHPQNSDELIRELRASDATTRVNAAEELSQSLTSSQQVVSALIAVSREDSDERVRDAATKALLAPIHQEIVQQNPALLVITTSPVEKATFWQRLAAYTLDGIILNIIILSLTCVLSSFAGELLAVLSWLLFLVYFAWAYSTSGQTIGKKILGIKVVSIDGSPLDWRKGVWRSLGYIPSSIFLDLGFLWSIWDQDKQAWHDKLAGTCVVRAATAREQLQGSIDPREARRRQARWRIGFGIPTLLILILGGSGSIYFIQRDTAEVRAMGPWPSPETSPEEIATLDLSHLGLELDEIKDARHEETWSEGNYEEGKLITYKSGTTPVVAIWALRYESKQLSADDYQSIQVSTEENCSMSSYATFGGVGIIKCVRGNDYHKIFRNDEWLVHILVAGGNKLESETVANEVRDALGSHWKDLEAP